MWFRHRAWVPVLWLLSAANVVAIYFAALPGEPLHASIHGLLGVMFGAGAQRLASRRALAGSADTADVAVRLGELEARMADLDALPQADNRLPELEERLDFIERTLVEVRNRAQLPRKE